MKFASIILSYNQAHFVLPHIKMLQKWGITPLVIQGRPWGTVPEHLETPDNTVSLLEGTGVRVISDRTDKFCAEAYNQGLEVLQDYDWVFRFDADMFIEDKYWPNFLAHIENSSCKGFRLNFRTTTRNYYLDYEHGVPDGIETDGIAIRSNERFSDLVVTPEPTETISDPNLVFVHHLKQVGKNEQIIKDFLAGKRSTTPEQLLKEFSPEGWTPLPQEIRDLLKPYEHLRPHADNQGQRSS